MWYGNETYSQCNQCPVGFVSASDNRDHWIRKIEEGVVIVVAKKSCPTCRAKNKERYRKRTSSPAPSSTSSVVTASTNQSLSSVVLPVLRAVSTSPRQGVLVRDPSPVPSIAPSIAPSIGSSDQVTTLSLSTLADERPTQPATP